jgi:hypothetical protein
MACSAVKVSFEEEQGEGQGVTRGFYAALAEALVDSTANFPAARDICFSSSPTPGEADTGSKLAATVLALQGRSVGEKVAVADKQIAELCLRLLHGGMVAYIIIASVCRLVC